MEATLVPEQPTVPAGPDTDQVLRGPGLDVSGHSGPVDWAAVSAAGYGYAFVKATEGVDLTDPLFAENWAALAASGMLRGAYHFYVTEDDPEEQARFFLETVSLEPGDLAPVVDVELVGHGTPDGWTEGLRVWLETVEEAVGVRPIIYTSLNFWNQHFDGSYGDYPLWIAEYEVDAPTLPIGWDQWVFWQWSADQAVEGVAVSADLDRGNAAVDDYAILRVPTP